MKCLTMKLVTTANNQGRIEAASLATLKAARDAAWAAINPNSPPGRENDWVAFAIANASWLEAYRKAHGGADPPEEDEITAACIQYYHKWCRR